jgi:hypothetical protein
MSLNLRISKTISQILTYFTPNFSSFNSAFSYISHIFLLFFSIAVSRLEDKKNRFFATAKNLVRLEAYISIIIWPTSVKFQHNIANYILIPYTKFQIST